jgi:hypothetical protein
VQCRLLALRVNSDSCLERSLLDNSGQNSILACDGLFANDPQATLAVQCSNGFDAGFSPFQSTRLSR